MNRLWISVLFVALAANSFASHPGTIAISDLIVYEPGQTLTRTATVTVTLSGPITEAVTVDYATADDTATQPGDYGATSGQITFMPSTASFQTATIEVPIYSDRVPEGDETFFVGVSVPHGEQAGVAIAPGTVTIRHTAKGDRDGDGLSEFLILHGEHDTIPPGCEAGGNRVPDINPHNNRHIDLRPTVMTEDHHVIDTTPISSVCSAEWQVAATGDFDGNSVVDLFWGKLDHDRGGAARSFARVHVSLTDGRNPYQPPTGEGLLPEGEGTVVGSGDVLGIAPGGSFRSRPMPQDGRADLVWHDTETGRVRVWVSDGQGFPEDQRWDIEAPPGWQSLSWQPRAVGDIDGDAVPEIVWSHKRSGLLHFWKLDGVFAEEHALNPDHTVDPGWEIVASGEFNGDGFDDLVWQNTVTGQVVVWLMTAAGRLDGGLVMPSNLDSTDSTNPAWWEVTGPR